MDVEFIKRKARLGDLDALADWTRLTPEYREDSAPLDFLLHRALGIDAEAAGEACREIVLRFNRLPEPGAPADTWEIAKLWTDASTQAGRRGVAVKKIEKGLFHLLLRLAVMALLLLPVVMACNSLADALTFFHLQRHGVSVTGRVTEVKTKVWTYPGKLGPRTYLEYCPVVTYKAEAKKSYQFPFCTYDYYKTGDAVQLLRDRDFPGVAALDDENTAATSLSIAILVFGFAGFFLLDYATDDTKSKARR